MATPRVYLDSCCFIEMLKGDHGLALDHPDDADMVRRLLRASRSQAIECWTSMIAVAEVLGVDKGGTPETALQKRIESLLLSGRDGVFVHGLSPTVVIKARDLVWKEGLRERAADRIHVATAIDLGCTEILSVDDRLAKRFKRTQISNCALRTAKETRSLPDEFKQATLFGDGTN
jgi:predicted nucleic acid-binding protein